MNKQHATSAADKAEMLQQQAMEMGITAQDIHQLGQRLLSGEVTSQEVLGLTRSEMQAIANRAEEHLATDLPKRR